MIREKIAEQTISSKILGAWNAFKLIQLVGLFLKVDFGKIDFGLESKHYSGVFLVAIAAFIENATIGTLKSKPILIRIFPTLTIKHQVLGSPLTGRDLFIGFDLLHQIPSLRWSSKGLMHKQHLLTWTQVPHLFTVDPFDFLKLQIISDCCANSHSEFLLKNPNPLWRFL